MERGGPVRILGQVYDSELLRLDGVRVLDGVERLLVEVVAQDDGHVSLGKGTLDVLQARQ